MHKMQAYAGGFPRMWLRIFGVCHLLAGLIQMVLAFAQLGVTERDKEELWVDPAISRYRFYMLYAAFAVLFSGIMMVVAGLLGVGALMTYDQFRQAATVSGFKLMTIVVAILFGPLSFGVGLTTAHLLSTDEDVGTIGLVICVFAGIQTFIAMCASCMTCCYSPYRDEPIDPYYGHDLADHPRLGGRLADMLRYGRHGGGPPSIADSLDFRGRLFGGRF